MMSQSLMERLHVSDRLALTCEAARCASDHEVRQQLLNVLADHTELERPKQEYSEILHVIEQCKGTELEPFVLSSGSLEVAARFTQLCFAESSQISSVRLISEDSLGARGGLLINHELASRYIERFEKRDGGLTNGSDPFWAMGEAYRPGSLESFFNPNWRVFCAPDDNSGFRLEIRCEDREKLGWFDGVFPGRLRADGSFRPRYGKIRTLTDCILQFSEVGNAGLSLAELGMICDESRSNRSTIKIYPGTPEAIVRFTAMLATGSNLVIGPFDGVKHPTRLTVQLGYPMESQIELKLRVDRLSPVLTDLMNAQIASEFRVDAETEKLIFETLEN